MWGFVRFYISSNNLIWLLLAWGLATGTMGCGRNREAAAVCFLVGIVRRV